MLFDNTSILLIPLTRGNIVELFKHSNEIKQDTHTHTTNEADERFYLKESGILFIYSFVN